MKWFKAIPPENPIMAELIKEFGFEGYGKFLAVLQRCLEFGYSEITPQLIQNTTGGNIRSASKVCPKFHQSFVNVSPMFDQTLTNVSPNFDQCLPNVSPMFDQTLTKLDPSNPHGSTRDLERIERIDKKEEKEKRKTLISDDWQPSEKFHKWLRENRPEITSAELDHQISKMKANHQANGRKYLDHEAALRNWFQSDFYKPMPKATTSGWRLPG